MTCVCGRGGGGGGGEHCWCMGSVHESSCSVQPLLILLSDACRHVGPYC